MKSSLFERSGMLLADALLGIALISSATIFLCYQSELEPRAD